MSGNAVKEVPPACFGKSVRLIRLLLRVLREHAEHAKTSRDAAGRRADARQPRVPGDPALRVAVVRTLIELAVRAEVVAALAVRGLPQVLRPVRGRLLLRLLRIEAGLREIAVQQPGEELLRGDGQR